MRQLPSGLPEIVEDGEDLARFLFSGHYKATAVKHTAFLPNPKDQETSVFRHTLKPAKELWKLGSDLASSGRDLRGVAIIKAYDVRNVGLDVIAAEPPQRHAAIRNWPADNDPILQKARQKELAILLAAAAGIPLLK
jgi:hypothetical protein